MDENILNRLTIGPEVSVRDAIAAIDRSGRQIALVVDQNRRLLATVTDGDVRRGILKGVDLEGPVTQVMNSSPKTVRQGDSDDALRRLMRSAPSQPEVLILSPPADLADGRRVAAAQP